MAKTCVQLITRIKQLVGRGGTFSSSTLDLDDIILDALNEAQLFIVRKNPQIIDLQVKDTATLTAATDTYSYSLSGFSPEIAHLQEVWIMDGTSSKQLHRLHKEDFDANYPDVSAIASGLPKYYTRRGSVIEFNCPVSSEYNGNAIRVDYCKRPADFASTTSTEASDLIDADRGLILFAWSDTLRTIARGNPGILSVADEKLALFKLWLETYSDYHAMQTEELTYGS